MVGGSRHIGDGFVDQRKLGPSVGGILRGRSRLEMIVSEVGGEQNLAGNDVRVHSLLCHRG